MPSPDPSSPPPTVFRPAEPARTEATRETGHRQRQTTNFDLSLDPRYYGLFGPPLRPGDIGSLARYRVIALLGEGGMGMVFRAEDVDLGREVALKVMRPEYAADRPLQQRFLREARHTAGLQHENVVTVYQVGEDSGTLFMALELLQGATLEQKLGVEQISLADALRIGREMACGLAAAHARGLIHRDVKPDNVWIESPHGRAKVLDFGLARPDRDSQILTHAGTVVGTPGYMSPEQSRAETLDERADVFSLGCVIYRMVTGYGPFPCRNFEEMCRAFKDSPPRRMSRLNDEVPPALDDLVAGMIEFDRDNRPASAREVALALAAIERSLGIDVDLRASLFPVPASGPRALPRSAADRLATEKKSLVARVWPRTTWGLVGAGVLAVALIAVLAFGLLHVPPGHVRIESPDASVTLVFTEERSRRNWRVSADEATLYRAPPGRYRVRVEGRPELVATPAMFELPTNTEQTVIVQPRAGRQREAPSPVPAKQTLNPELLPLDHRG